MINWQHLMGLSQDIAALEQARTDGVLKGRDLEVIATQISRAEAKILRAAKASAYTVPALAALLSVD